MVVNSIQCTKSKVKEVSALNPQRAKEISESPVMANVTYGGEAVYIQRVDEQNQMARIFPLSEPQNEKEVSVEQLEEQ